MEIDGELKRLFAGTSIKELPQDYMIISLDPSSDIKAQGLIDDVTPFFSITYEEEEISIIMRSDIWDDHKQIFENYQVGGPYRVITFDIILDLSIVGYLVVISKILADNDISIYALSTYLRDHILIRKEDAPKALYTLKNLIEDAKEA